MKKIQENKKIWIFAGVVLLVVIIIFLATYCGKKNDEQETNSDKSGQETVIDKDDLDGSSSTGLEVTEPEEADKAETENKVEFVGPDEGSNGIAHSESNSDNASVSDSDNNDNSDNINDNKDTNNSEDIGNLDEEPDSNGQYGGFF